MKQSSYRIKTLRETPSDADNVSAALLVRAGFVDKLGAGIYTLLPLGYRVLTKIENIIRKEMNAIGGQELLMPALLPKEYWERTGRWESMDAVLYKIKSGSQEYALGATHEEIVAPVAKKMISSYRDLPLYLYQIQTKFRSEARAKSGLLRGREFGMKDLYSFHTDEKDLNIYYDKVAETYRRIFDRIGIGGDTYMTYASGGDFSKYSHEFQTIAESGEDTIHLCEKCRIAINKEIIDEQDSCPSCDNKDLVAKKAIEVGNIFKLGTKFSQPNDLSYLDKDGKKQLVIMASYGIGPTRAMATVVEKMYDTAGMIWPEEVAPFQVHLLSLGDDKKVQKEADKLYKDLIKKGIEVLYDDRDESAGTKLKDADLIGIPYRVVVSEKSLKEGSVEVKKRSEKSIELVKAVDIVKLVIR